jgi:hypothetical protein
MMNRSFRICREEGRERRGGRVSGEGERAGEGPWSVAYLRASEEPAMEDCEASNRARAVAVALMVLLDAVLHVSPEVEEHPLELVHRRDVTLPGILRERERQAGREGDGPSSSERQRALI